MTPADRQPIIVAEGGPLIHLAAVGLLDALGGPNRPVVLADGIVDEVCGDPVQPFARDVADRIAGTGDAIWPATTPIGLGIETLRARARTPDEETAVKQALRNSGERAVRAFIDGWMPEHPGAAVVVCEDRKVATLFVETDHPVTLMTTRAFVQVVARRGANVDAVEAVEGVDSLYDLKSALIAGVHPTLPSDLRTLPRPPEPAKDPTP